MKRKQWCAVGCLATLFAAAPAMAGDEGTYVPGRTRDPAPYTMQGSAVRHQTARGGGPTVTNGAQREARSSTPARTSRTRMRGLQSDNQTRRPGAVNYTGRAFKGGQNAHEIADPTPVSLAGDHFQSHTGAHNIGRIEARAEASNEREFDKREIAGPPPDARGGGPTAGPYVVVPGGHVEMLAPSRPVLWSATMPVLERGAEPPLTSDDLRDLPSAGDGTAFRRPGLLALTPSVTHADLIDTAAVASVDGSFETLSTLQTTARPVAGIGGGPRATGTTGTPGTNTRTTNTDRNDR